MKIIKTILLTGMLLSPSVFAANATGPAPSGAGMGGTNASGINKPFGTAGTSAGAGMGGTSAANATPAENTNPDAKKDQAGTVASGVNKPFGTAGTSAGAGMGGTSAANATPAQNTNTTPAQNTDPDATQDQADTVVEGD